MYDEHDENDTMMKTMRNNLISITAPILKCFAKMSTKMTYILKTMNEKKNRAKRKRMKYGYLVAESLVAVPAGLAGKGRGDGGRGPRGVRPTWTDTRVRGYTLGHSKFDTLLHC